MAQKNITKPQLYQRRIQTISGNLLRPSQDGPTNFAITIPYGKQAR